MYNFVDTTEVSVGTLLPSEALMINGEYIENLVQGYRTLTVSGREALSPELNVHDTVTRDGSILKSRRYPARTIKIQYQLIAENAEAYRAAYNQLARVLDVENAQLIFNDEPDKYFTGTVSYIGEVEAGRNSVVGEFEIYCADPFKYSVAEYEVEAQDVAITDENGKTIVNKMFVVDYNGTYKAFPTITTEFYKETGELTGDGDCGYVAFIDADGSIVQVGDPAETDGEDYEASQTLIYNDFTTIGSIDNVYADGWQKNCAVESPLYAGSISQSGDLTVAGSLRGDFYNITTNKPSLGATVTKRIPADAKGEVGATNFTTTYISFVSPTSKGYSAAHEVLLVNGSGANRTVVAGVCVRRVSGIAVYVYLYINGEKIKTINISVSNGMPKGGTITISKERDTVTFNIFGTAYSYTNDAIADVKTEEISINFVTLGSSDARGSAYVQNIKFVKNSCDTWGDIPNKFSTGDIVTVDCRKADIAVNGLRSPEYGALGNDWEKFFLKSGLNNISIAYSDWLTGEYVPTFKMRYREVFL